MLLMIVGGIGLSQAVSDPRQVTLRWLRLGGLIAVCLVAVAAAVWAITTQQDQPFIRNGIALTATIAVTQLIAIQKAWRRVARLASCFMFCIASGVAWCGLMSLGPAGHDTTATATLTQLLAQPQAWVVFSATLSSTGLLGGLLMTMLLGHAYLTAGGEMTQAPFQRLVLTLAGLLGLRIVGATLFGLWPFWALETPALNLMWTTVMVTARYAVGLIVPGIFLFMTYDCVKRRANQSATGILYVATVLITLGEGVSLALLEPARWVF